MPLTPEDPFDTGLKPDDLSPDRPTPVETPWGTFALYPTPSGPRAAEAFCPHIQGPLWEGTLSDHTITCPWHQWRFDLNTGCLVDSPGDVDGEPCIKTLAAELGEGGTWILSPD